jgi:DNA-binding NtrC family response regulator
MAEQIIANVLLVDDEEQFVSTLSQRLQTRGLKVDGVTSGEDALKKVKQKDFDAILLDLSMPGLDGMEVLHRIKADNPDIQVIILTGHASIEKGVEAIKDGAVDFLEKPVDMKVLLEKIGAAKRKHAIIVSKKSEDKVKSILEAKGW